MNILEESMIIGVTFFSGAVFGIFLALLIWIIYKLFSRWKSFWSVIDYYHKLTMNGQN